MSSGFDLTILLPLMNNKHARRTFISIQHFVQQGDPYDVTLKFSRHGHSMRFPQTRLDEVLDVLKLPSFETQEDIVFSSHYDLRTVVYQVMNKRFKTASFEYTRPSLLVPPDFHTPWWKVDARFVEFNMKTFNDQLLKFLRGAIRSPTKMFHLILHDVPSSDMWGWYTLSGCVLTLNIKMPSDVEQMKRKIAALCEELRYKVILLLPDRQVFSRSSRRHLWHGWHHIRSIPRLYDIVYHGSRPYVNTTTGRLFLHEIEFDDDLELPSTSFAASDAPVWRLLNRRSRPLLLIVRARMLQHRLGRRRGAKCQYRSRDRRFERYRSAGPDHTTTGVGGVCGARSGCHPELSRCETVPN